MLIIHTRRQHPVGQGFFHSGTIHKTYTKRERSGSWHYVIDCGSKNKYNSELREQIHTFVDTVGPGGTLDLLMVSHFHADHVSGIERLLDPTHGLNVDTIMMPLTTVEERLIAFAQSVEEDASAASDSFYQRIVATPEAALSEFGPRRIVFVRRGNLDDGAPNGTEDPIPPFPDDKRPPDPESRKPSRRFRDWSFVGKGPIDVRIGSSASSATGGAPRVYEMPDSAGIAVPLRHRRMNWLIAPYVDPAVEATKTKFERSLARRLGMKVADFRKEKSCTNFVRGLLIKNTEELKAAYRTVASDLNITSLCIYSGPPVYCNIPYPGWYECGYGRNESVFCHCNLEGVGWLGTGDAALKQQCRLDAFLGHFRRHLRNVSTLTMPHHGSDRNFHPDLLDRVAPIHCIVSADEYSNWRHPGTKVIQSVASSGTLLFVTTADPRSEFEEELTFRL